MYDDLIQDALDAITSDDQTRMIETIRRIILTVPDEMTNAALERWLSN